MNLAGERRVRPAPQLNFGTDRLDMIAALERTHFWFVGRRLLVRTLLAHLGLGAGSTVLDVGCGTGSLASQLAASGCRVLALDPQPDAFSRHSGPRPAALQFARADAEHLPVADNSFQAAIALDVLEHTDDERAIAEIVRVLQPGGAVVITVPALPWLWSRRDVNAGHQRRYTRRRLEQLLARAGLDVVEVRFYQCLLLPVFVVTRLAARRSSRPLGAEERPADWLNRVGLWINRFEVRTGDVIAWPVGSSLAAVGRKRL